MRFKLITLLAVSLFGIQNAHAVVIDGKEWRQLTETTNVSWLIVNNACGSGVCSGSIGDVSVDGWHWAANSDVQGLFEALIKPGTTQFPTPTTSYFAPGDADIAAAVTSVFDPTWIFNLGANQYREVRGLTRSLTGGQATMAYLSDSPFATTLDYAAFDTAYPTNLGSPNTGLWLYKPASVPEPGTLALLGVALGGIGLARRHSRKPDAAWARRSSSSLPSST